MAQPLRLALVGDWSVAISPVSHGAKTARVENAWMRCVKILIEGLCNQTNTAKVSACRLWRLLNQIAGLRLLQVKMQDTPTVECLGVVECMQYTHLQIAISTQVPTDIGA